MGFARHIDRHGGLLMSPIQFAAIVRLKSLRPTSKACAAAYDVFVNDMSMYAAAKKHECSQPTVQAACTTIRSALNDCAIVITGEK